MLPITPPSYCSFICAPAIFYVCWTQQAAETAEVIRYEHKAKQKYIPLLNYPYNTVSGGQWVRLEASIVTRRCTITFRIIKLARRCDGESLNSGSFLIKGDIERYFNTCVNGISFKLFDNVTKFHTNESFVFDQFQICPCDVR